MDYKTANRQKEASKLLTKNFRTTGNNIKGDGVKLCRRAKAFNSENPDTAYIAVKTNNKNVRTADMVDVAHCGNAHLCAYCTALKAAHMRDWIVEVLVPALNKKKLLLGMLTLTAHHTREMNWSTFVYNFYKALADFKYSIRYWLKTIGSVGRLRGVEATVGKNGLHFHIHDQITYTSTCDIDAFIAVLLTKWQAALDKHGLKCNKHGVKFSKHGTYNLTYIAKDGAEGIAGEMASYDTKTDSKSDGKTLFQLLDLSKKGDVEAGKDWTRAAKALEGRDRWNVGQLADNLGIDCPSEWRRPKDLSLEEEPEDKNLISYPQVQHMLATSPDNPRDGLALAFRAALQEDKHQGSTQRMILRMCETAQDGKVELIIQKHATKAGYKLLDAKTPEEKVRIIKIQTDLCNFEIDDYKLNIHNAIFPVPLNLPTLATTPIVIPEITYDLDFA